MARPGVDSISILQRRGKNLAASNTALSLGCRHAALLIASDWRVHDSSAKSDPEVVLRLCPLRLEARAPSYYVGIALRCYSARIVGSQSVLRDWHWYGCHDEKAETYYSTGME